MAPYAMKVFRHHIYEFKKGLRDLVLCTERSTNRDAIEERLLAEGIAYVIHELDGDRINVYFGRESCVRVVETFATAKLNELSDEQDFMLGVMLGYGRFVQCDRYLQRRSRRRRSFERCEPVLRGGGSDAPVCEQAGASGERCSE